MCFLFRGRKLYSELREYIDRWMTRTPGAHTMTLWEDAQFVLILRLSVGKAKDATGEGGGDSRCAVTDRKFFEDAHDVTLHRRLADEQLPSDFGIGQSIRDALQHLQL